MTFHSLMYVHPCHAWLIVTMHHAVELPAIAFVKTGVVSNKIQWCNAFAAHVFYRHVQKSPGNAMTPVVFFSINGTDIWGQILTVMKVVIDDAQTSYDLFFLKA